MLCPMTKRVMLLASLVLLLNGCALALLDIDNTIGTVKRCGYGGLLVNCSQTTTPEQRQGDGQDHRRGDVR